VIKVTFSFVSGNLISYISYLLKKITTSDNTFTICEFDMCWEIFLIASIWVRQFINRSINSLRRLDRMIHRVAKPNLFESSPWEAYKKIEILKYSEHISGTLRPTFRTHNNPLFRNMSTHDPDAWRHTGRTRGTPCFRCKKTHDPSNGRPTVRWSTPFYSEKNQFSHLL
jgi:hypothetical protein